MEIISKTQTFLKLVINQLIMKQHKMENEISCLKHIIYGNNKNKITNKNIIDILNKNKIPKYDLNQWIKNMVINNDDLIQCLNKGFVQGFYTIFV